MVSIVIQSKTTVFVAKVTYATYDTLVDPCDYLVSSLEDLVVKGLGLLSGDITACSVVSVTSGVNGKNVYLFEVTVETTA